MQKSCKKVNFTAQMYDEVAECMHFYVVSASLGGSLVLHLVVKSQFCYQMLQHSQPSLVLHLVVKSQFCYQMLPK